MKTSRVLKALFSLFLILIISTTGAVFADKPYRAEDNKAGVGEPIVINYKLSGTENCKKYIKDGHFTYLGNPVECVFKIKIQGRKSIDDPYEFVAEGPVPTGS